MAARNISVPTNNCEIAAACGEAGDRVKAFVSYGDGMAVDYGDRRARKSYHETSCEYNRPRKGNTIEAQELVKCAGTSELCSTSYRL